MNLRRTLAAVLSAAMLAGLVPAPASAFVPEDIPDTAPAAVAEPAAEPETETAVPEDMPDAFPEEDEGTPAAMAAVLSGSCGENVFWRYDIAARELRIEGSGMMDDALYESGMADYAPEVLTLVISSGVTGVDLASFTSFRALRAVTVEEGNPVFSDAGGVLFSADGTELVFYPHGLSGSYAIPSGVTSVGACAFLDCTGLKSIEIPFSVNSVGQYAFWRCGGLERVVYDGDQNEWGRLEIGAGNECLTGAARQYLRQYEEKYSGRYYYYDQCMQWSLDIRTGELRISGRGAVPGYFAALCGDGEDERFSFDDDLFGGLLPWDYYSEYVRSIVLGSGVEEIYPHAFAGLDRLESVTIPAGMRAIYSKAFDGCTALKRVEIASMESWCGISFSGLRANPLYYAGMLYLGDEPLREVTIPDGVTEIGDYAFAGGTGITRVNLPAGLEDIGIYAFIYCDSLTELLIPQGCSSIHAYAFRKCSGLTSVSLPAELSYIGLYAFSMCDGIADVTYAGTPLQWKSVRIAHDNECLTRALHISADITAQPQSVTVSVGENARFTVAAVGTGLAYQWQYQAPGSGKWANTALAGNRSAALTVPALAGRNGYAYRCIVKDNAGNAVTSEPAVLTVRIPLAITAHPQDVTQPVGSTALFTAAASGEGLAYQWQYKATPGGAWKNNTTLAGCRTDTLSVPVTAARGGYQYRCKVTDSTGAAVYSEPALLAVRVPLAITAQPQSVTAGAGGTARFTVIAAGTGLSYQWQYRATPGGAWKNNTTLTGCRTDALTVPAALGRNGYQYRCKVTDSAGTVVYSAAALLTVKSFCITAQPQDVTVSAGGNARFTVDALGIGVTYQWQYRAVPGGAWKNNTTLAGCRTNALTVPATAARNGYQYRCVVTDGVSTLYSEPAVLTVMIPLTVTAHPVNVTVYAGSTARFTAAAAGQELAYQWQYRAVPGGAWKNNTTLPGCTSPTLSVPAAAGRDGYAYRCVIADAYGNLAVTDAAVLRVV